MNKTAEYIFSTLRTSKVSISDFARITGISRQSLHHWKRGGTVNDRIRLTMAYNTALRIEKALLAKRLPLSKDSRKVDERVAVLKRVIMGG